MPSGFDLEGPADAVQWSRADLVLARRAARERWGVPDALKTEAIFQATKILADAHAEPRDKLAAMRLLATFDKTDQDDEKIALAKEKLELEREKLARDEARPSRSPLVVFLSSLNRDELDTLESIADRLVDGRPAGLPGPGAGGEVPAEPV